MKTIIPIFGNAGHGKSTVAKIISDLTGGSVRNFADPLKEVAKAMIGIPLSVSHGSQEDKENTMFYGKSARQHLQWIGTEVGKDGVHPSVWVDRFLEASLEDTNPVTIAGDGRFPSDEYHYLKDKASTRARVISLVIRRPDVDVNMAHRSESIVAEWPDNDFAWVITNTGSMEELVDKVGEFLAWADITKEEEDRSQRRDFIRTFQGKAYFPIDPRVEDVDAVDIAHGLAKTDRWNRQARVMVSVGLHSINVMKIAAVLGHPRPTLVMLYALLHDAHEAYLADMPRPVKKFIPGWTEIEDKNDAVIYEHFGLEYPVPADIKAVVEKADYYMAWIEGCEFTKHDPAHLGEGPPEGLRELAGVSFKEDESPIAVREQFLYYLDKLLALNKGE